MSIRVKLQVALWAMVIVPNVIMISLIVTLLYFLSDQTLHELMNDEKNLAYRQAVVQGELSFVLDHDPDLLKDEAYLSKLQARFAELYAGMVLVRDGEAPIVAPMLQEAVHSADWNEIIDDNEREQMTIGGYLYKIHRFDVTFEDGSHGEAALFRQKEALPLYWRVLVPLILLIALVATSITLTYVVSRSIIRPLYALKRAAEQMSEGQLDGEMKPTTKDEIGELSEAFEAMRKRLKATLEERLQDEDNRKMLLSHISHDLKTPITAIKGYVEGILDGVANTRERQEKYLRTVYRKATDMDRLIDELFLFSKLDMRHVTYDFRPVDIRRFIAHYAEEQLFELEKDGIALNVTGAEGEPLLVTADPEKLSRVFHNMIGNSVKYMPDESPESKRVVLITVQAVSSGNVEVELRDSGPGVSPEALPNLFDQFYRTEQSRSTETGGSGLGLAIVKQIVEGHGGSVRASLPPDGGLAITVQLRRWTEDIDNDMIGR